MIYFLVGNAAHILVRFGGGDSPLRLALHSLNEDRSFNAVSNGCGPLEVTVIPGANQLSTFPSNTSMSLLYDIFFRSAPLGDPYRVELIAPLEERMMLTLW